jgi:hypothetical protein
MIKVVLSLPCGQSHIDTNWSCVLLSVAVGGIRSSRAGPKEEGRSVECGGSLGEISKTGRGNNMKSEKNAVLLLKFERLGAEEKSKEVR